MALPFMLVALPYAETIVSAGSAYGATGRADIAGGGFGHDSIIARLRNTPNRRTFGPQTVFFKRKTPRIELLQCLQK